MSQRPGQPSTAASEAVGPATEDWFRKALAALAAEMDSINRRLDDVEARLGDVDSSALPLGERMDALLTVVGKELARLSLAAGLEPGERSTVELGERVEAEARESR